MSLLAATLLVSCDARPLGLALGAIAILAAALALWRGSRPWVAAAALAAGLAVAWALLRARALHGHTADTQAALGAGLVALIALMIRFGLGGVTGRLVVDPRGPQRGARRAPDPPPPRAGRRSA